MLEDLLHSDRLEIVDRRMETHGLDDWRSPGLEPMGDLGPGCGLKRHVRDHLAAPFEGLGFLQGIHPTPKHADPGRSEHLV